jgi:hypothetical protein
MEKFEKNLRSGAKTQCLANWVRKECPKRKKGLDSLQTPLPGTFPPVTRSWTNVVFRVPGPVPAGAPC